MLEHFQLENIHECVSNFDDGAESHLENTQATVHKDAVYS